jgi:hypothetical protein
MRSSHVARISDELEAKGLLLTRRSSIKPLLKQEEGYFDSQSVLSPSEKGGAERPVANSSSA